MGYTILSANFPFNGPCIQDLRHCPALKVFGAKLHLLSVIIFLPEEKRRSEETEVAGIAR
jgi:hypothetical protein